MRDDRRALAFPLRVTRDMIGVPMRGHDIFQILSGRLFDEFAHDIGLVGFFQSVNHGGAVAEVIPCDIVNRDAQPNARADFFDFVLFPFVRICHRRKV